MKAETADYLAKARTTLADARHIVALPLPHIAALEAYLAVFHAAEAYIFELTGKVAKTHRGVRSVGRDLVTFLGAAYQFKTRADYAIGATAAPITAAEQMLPSARGRASSTPQSNFCRHLSRRAAQPRRLELHVL